LLIKENNELSYKRKVFDDVRQRLEQKNMERNVPGSIDVQAWAFASSEPYNDRRPVFTAMALGLGLCLGTGAAFLRASKNQVIYTPQDIPQPIHLPMLGYIPLVNLRKSLGKGLSTELKQKHFLMNESIRFIRTALHTRLDSCDSAAILITSSISGTGKSSFTNFLGQSIAQTGKSVLLIDTDLHKMSLSGYYGLLDSPGFMNYLDPDLKKTPYIYNTNIPGLSVMPGGVRTNGRFAFEEIAKNSFNESFNKLRQQFQVILMDSPPVLPITDAVILSAQVDDTILVERELISHREDIASTIARLNSAGGQIFGFVFVGSIDYKKNAYYSYYYNPYNEE
jgi:capsular exopolysaccharide synthesis family protein